MIRNIAVFYITFGALLSGLCYAQAPVSGSGTSAMSVELRLERLERMLQSQGLVDMLQQLQQLQREISSLRGEIETQNYNLEQLTRRQRDLYTDVDQRMQRLERGGLAAEEPVIFNSEETPLGGEPPLETLTAMPSFSGSNSTLRSNSALTVEIVDTASIPQSNQPVVADPSETSSPPVAIVGQGQVTESTQVTEVSPVTTTQVVPVDPVQLQAEYQQAFNLLRQSLYDRAIRAFQQFLALHPKDMYSDNAQYWLAEAFYVKREFEQALIEYKNVVSNFPESQKVNDALLKIGFTLYEMGDTESAKTQLQQLAEKLPGSTVARLANERLKIINSATPNTPAVSD